MRLRRLLAGATLSSLVAMGAFVAASPAMATDGTTDVPGGAPSETTETTTENQGTGEQPGSEAPEENPGDAPGTGSEGSGSGSEGQDAADAGVPAQPLLLPAAGANPRGTGSEFVLDTDITGNAGYQGWHLENGGSVETLAYMHLADGLRVTKNTQVLYGFPASGDSTPSIENGMLLADTLSVGSSGTVFAQLPVFIGPDREFTTFRTQLPITSGSKWQSSQTTTAFAKNTDYSLSDIQANIGQHVLLGYGFLVTGGDADVWSVSFAGYTTNFYQDYDEEPVFTPEEPAATEAGLPADKQDDELIVSQPTPTTVVLRAPTPTGMQPLAAGPSDWFFVYGYSTPTPLGWVQSVDGFLTVDVSALGSGTHTLAVLDQAGNVAAWASITLQGAGGTGGTVSTTGGGAKSLANTGAGSTGLAGIGALGLLVAGAAAAGIGLRRRGAL